MKEYDKLVRLAALCVMQAHAANLCVTVSHSVFDWNKFFTHTMLTVLILSLCFKMKGARLVFWDFYIHSQ